MNLFTEIKSKYGREAVKVVRDYETIAKKIARFRNHLVLSLRCKQSRIHPSSLKLRCPVNSERAKAIVINAEQRLFNERIRVINGKLIALRADFSTAAESVKCVLSADLAEAVVSHVSLVQDKEFEITKAHHRKKFERLLEAKKKQETSAKEAHSEDQRDRWVINLSHTELSTHQKNVLAKGLNFAITPNHLPKEDFVVTVEKACRSMEEEVAEGFRNEVLGTLRSAKCPQSNLTVQEQQAVSDLKSNPMVMVLPADKGRATVVLDKAEYEEKVLHMLSDEKTYQKLKKDPTTSYKGKLVSILSRLKDEGKLSDDLYIQLYPTSEKIPQLYCLPKVHKKDVPFRPIVDYTGSIGYNTCLLYTSPSPRD